MEDKEPTHPQGSDRGLRGPSRSLQVSFPEPRRWLAPCLDRREQLSEVLLMAVGKVLRGVAAA